jgi:hypothetical protein
MPLDFIEITQVQIIGQGHHIDAETKIIGRAHIVSVRQGLSNTSVLTLSNGEILSVEESYEDLKNRLLGEDGLGI